MKKILWLLPFIVFTSCSSVYRSISSVALNENSNIDLVPVNKVILNGKKLKDSSKSWRSVVRIIVENQDTGDQYLCSGVLIDQKALMTAAHCLYSNGSHLKVRTIQYFKGSQKAKKVSIKKSQTRNHIHPEYFYDTSLMSYDVALVEFIGKPFEREYHPVTWNNGDHFDRWDELMGETLYVVGASRNGVGTLSYARGVVFQSSTGGIRMNGLNLKEGTCKGDSGGALFGYFESELVFLGIHTSGLLKQQQVNKCAHGGSFSAFNSEIRKWVRDTLNSYSTI